MKYYNYKLMNLLNEETINSDDGKIENNQESQGDYNLKQVANSVAIAVKSHSDFKARLDAKNLIASGKLKVKAGEDVNISGEAELNMATGKANITVPINIKDKKVNLSIENLNVANLNDIYKKEIQGSFIDPELNKKINIKIQIIPNKNKYSFSVGEQKGNLSFDVKLNVDKSVITSGGKIGFDSQDFIPSKFAPNIAVGLDFDKEGLSGNILAKNDIKLRTGTLAISAKGEVGSGKKYIGGELEYTPGYKKNQLGQDRITKAATKGMKKSTKYVSFGDDSKGGGFKTVKDKKGKETTKIEKDIEDTTKVLKSIFKENVLNISKKDLRILIEKLLNRRK